MTTFGSRVLPLVALLLGGCLQSEQADPSRAPQSPSQTSFFSDAVVTNGVQLNGAQLNGVQLNGVQLNGVQLNGVQLNGSQLSASAIDGTQSVMSGVALSGAVFTLTVTEAGAPVGYELKLDSVYVDPLNPSGDVYLYDVSFRRPGATAWATLCKDGAGKGVPALLLSNYWDPSNGSRVDAPGAITLACSNAALGKCVRWGYRPWATSTMCSDGVCRTVSLADHHQACTRMVRADYCGNGTAHTVDGTPIDVFDNLAPQAQSRSTSWQVEAKWTPRGATCLGKTRATQLLDEAKYPDCNGDGKKDDFTKCDNDDYTLSLPNLLGNGFDK